jgi:hypothetical protein
MKFQVKAADIVHATDIVSVVTPVSYDKNVPPGYLFVIRGDQTCTVYSQGKTHAAAAPLPVTDVEGEGAFLYDFVSGFKEFRPDETLSFEVGEENGKFFVNYSSESGAEVERPSFDPKGIRPVVAREAKDTDPELPTALFKRAIDTVKGSLPDPKQDLKGKIKPYYYSIQLFDQSKPEWAKGNGNLFASDGHRGAYFYCDKFLDKSLAIAASDIPVVMTFLSRCDGDVKLREDDNWTFLADSKGNMVGWTHSAVAHPRYNYYPEESIQLIVDADFLGRTLRLMKAELENSKDSTKTLEKLKVVYTAGERGQLQFFFNEKKGKAKSPLVLVKPDTEEAKTRNFSTNVNIYHFMNLVDSLESNEIRLKVMITPPKEGRKNEWVHFRIEETIYITPEGKVLPGPEGASQCKVTRFIPSLD